MYGFAALHNILIICVITWEFPIVLSLHCRWIKGRDAAFRKSSMTRRMKAKELNSPAKEMYLLDMVPVYTCSRQMESKLLARFIEFGRSSKMETIWEEKIGIKVGQGKEEFDGWWYCSVGKVPHQNWRWPKLHILFFGPSNTSRQFNNLSLARIS